MIIALFMYKHLYSQYSETSNDSPVDIRPSSNRLTRYLYEFRSGPPRRYINLDDCFNIAYAYRRRRQPLRGNAPRGRVVRIKIFAVSSDVPSALRFSLFVSILTVIFVLIIRDHPATVLFTRATNFDSICFLLLPPPQRPRRY